MQQNEKSLRDSRRYCDVSDIAAWLACSERHVFRMVEQGRLPKPTKIGALSRWRRETIESWLATKPQDAAGMTDGGEA